MDQQRADGESGLGVRGRASGAGRSSIIETLDECLIALAQHLEIPAERDEPRRGSGIGHFGVENQRIRGHFSRWCGGVAPVARVFGMCEDAVADFAEPAPREIASQRLPFCSRHRRQDHQSPAPRPLRCRTAVNPRGGFGKALSPAGGEPVLAQVADAAGIEPSLLGEARCCGAHQALVEAEGRRNANEAAQRNRAAPRHDAVAEDRHDERAGAQRALMAEARDESGRNGGKGGGHRCFVL